jgi:hypothetical protein
MSIADFFTNPPFWFRAIVWIFGALFALIGLVVGLWQVFTHQTVPEVLAGREWRFGAANLQGWVYIGGATVLSVLLALTLLRPAASRYSDEGYKPTVVTGKTYVNEVVPLDGYHYTGCVFRNVTFEYKRRPSSWLAFRSRRVQLTRFRWFPRWM